MPIFRLESDELIIAQETDLELETHLETWLENSPQALAQEFFLWIGRQPSAADEEGVIFPDLLGVDSEGNLIIVELKRERAPRDVMAQLLEYAVWASELSEAQIHQIAETYFATRDEFKGKVFHDTFRDKFDIPEIDELPVLNRGLRLFIVAEEVPTRVARVCRFLRTSHGMDITCIDVSTFQTEAGEKLISMETKVGDEDVITSKAQKQSNSQTSRWSGDKPIKQVVWEGVEDFIDGDVGIEFTIAEVKKVILKKYPDFKPRNVGAEIAADCVNHSSRHHYPGGIDRYWQIERGRYRLYDPEKDKIEE
ncbi:MAG: hypothetical protein OXU27_06195 [Candidatus Poribacteria bacterium]|nr:hypothetical protein [Candidatus Poribacteria bacterium]